MKRLHFAAAALALLAAVPASAQRPQSVTIGSFHYVHRTDPLDDTDVSAVAVEETPRKLLGSTLVWRCEKGGYSIGIDTPLFTMDDEVTAEWRFDQEEPQMGAWPVTQSHDMWVPSEVANDFTDGARRASRVAVRFTTRGGEQTTAVFMLNGATAALRHLPCMDWRNYPQTDTTAVQP